MCHQIASINQLDEFLSRIMHAKERQGKTFVLIGHVTILVQIFQLSRLIPCYTLIWIKVSRLTILPAIQAINSRIQYTIKYRLSARIREKLIWKGSSLSFESLAWLLWFYFDYISTLKFDAFKSSIMIDFNFSAILKLYFIGTHIEIYSKDGQLSRLNYCLIVVTLEWNNTKQFE